jgi:hypothetical protein
MLYIDLYINIVMNTYEAINEIAVQIQNLTLAHNQLQDNVSSLVTAIQQLVIAVKSLDKKYELIQIENEQALSDLKLAILMRDRIR